jgi:hypothetical protein
MTMTTPYQDLLAKAAQARKATDMQRESAAQIAQEAAANRQAPAPPPAGQGAPDVSP